MIRYTQGNLLEANVEALVNTVNEVGVMGKGIALQFKEAFPENYEAYKAACNQDEVTTGKMFVTATGRLDGLKWIINFPTKKHWRHPSRIQYIEKGLADLRRVIGELNIRSIAVPPLGCGNGGLPWPEVRDLAEKALGDLNSVDVLIYEPISKYQAATKAAGVEQLTPARAMLIDGIRRYSVLGLECTNLEVQKLAYFLQRALLGLRLQNPFRLDFVANKYGPYADALRHLLNGLDGSYLHCDKRLADAGPMEPIRLDYGRLQRVQTFLKGEKDFLAALQLIDRLIDGFQSPYLMELLATVDWVVRERGGNCDVHEIRSALAAWPGGRSAGRRKLELFDAPAISLALDRLRREAPVLYPG